MQTTTLDLQLDLCQFFFHLNSARRDMCDTSMESFNHGLQFLLLDLKTLSNLWGHYYPRKEKKRYDDMLIATVSFLHIELGVLTLLKALAKRFISSSNTN